MKVVKTLQHKIMNHTRIFDETLDIYNAALSFIIEVMDKEFTDIDNHTIKSIVPAVEKLIHVTKSNPLPKYKVFDLLFYKFPSYFRRSAIASAFGKITSYRSNFKNWAEKKKIALVEDKKFKKNPPKLQFEHKEFPVFYKGNMFERTSDTTAVIKVFHQNDWVWVAVAFKEQNIYKRDVWGWEENNSKLVRVGKKYFLTISYESKIKLPKTKINDQKVCAVDLGINNSAVCSIMNANGTVLDHNFINQPIKKDQLYTITNKLRKAQSVPGWVSAPNYWRKINGLQKHMVNNTSHEIVKLAKENKCDVIVFEYLGSMKMPKGFYGAKKLRFKLRYWWKMGIQNKIEEMAHYVGMRISRINANNTSALAFDGSGKVERNEMVKKPCHFFNGQNLSCGFISNV